MKRIDTIIDLVFSIIFTCFYLYISFTESIPMWVKIFTWCACSIIILYCISSLVKWIGNRKKIKENK